MAKTATKKVTKKVSTAKGKGKPAKAKVVKKTATKKAVTKKAVKKVTKKAVAKKPAVKKTKVVTDPYAFKNPSKTNPYPYFRYANVSVSDVSNEKYPELVMITAGPAKYADLVGRKYINKEFAVKAILAYQAEGLIAGGKKAVKKELLGLGIGVATDYTDVDLSNTTHEQMIALQDKVRDEYEA
jgi:hypothetical protein